MRDIPPPPSMVVKVADRRKTQQARWYPCTDLEFQAKGGKVVLRGHHIAGVLKLEVELDPAELFRVFETWKRDQVQERRG